MSSKDVSKYDDIIDSRDVIARIAELQDAAENDADMDEDDRAELAALLKLEEQGSSYASDWAHGEALIRDSYFTTYAQELAEDIGAVDRDVKWPYTCIDWEQAARELQQDYTSIDFDGETYWTR